MSRGLRQRHALNLSSSCCLGAAVYLNVPNARVFRTCFARDAGGQR
jgi:hypothetical protein